MANGVQSRIRAAGSGAFRLIPNLFLARLTLVCGRLWRQAPVLALILAAQLPACLMAGWLSAQILFGLLQPAATSPIGPAIAAALAFAVVAELCAASIMAMLRALLQLADDTGRDRVGAILTLLASLAAAGALLDLFVTGGFAIAGLPALFLPVLALLAFALWFDRTYRHPMARDFRDFRADLIEARRQLARPLHGR